MTGRESLRAQIERRTNVQSMRTMAQSRSTLVAASQIFKTHMARPSAARADALRAYIKRLKS